MSGERYTLMQDDDCHWYCVPVADLESVEVAFSRCEVGEETGEDLALIVSCRINGPHRLTFTNPEEL